MVSDSVFINDTYIDSICADNSIKVMPYIVLFGRYGTT